MAKLIDLLGLSRFKTKCDALYAKAADTYTKTEVDALEDLKVDKTSNPITSVTETDGTVTVSALDGTETTFEAGGNITIDDAVSSISENPVKNKAVTAYLYALQNKIANITLSSTTNSTTGAKNIVLTKGDGTKTGVTVTDQNVKMSSIASAPSTYRYPVLCGALTSAQMSLYLTGTTNFYAPAGITPLSSAGMYFMPKSGTLYCPKISFSGGTTTTLLSSIEANTSAIEALGTPVSGVSIADNTMTVTKTDGTSEDFSTYSLPIATADTLGGIKVGTGLAIDDDGTLSASGVDVDLSPYAKTADLATVATSGSYNDLTDTPSLDEKLSKTGDTATDLTVTDLTCTYLRTKNGLTMYTPVEDDDGNITSWNAHKLMDADNVVLTSTTTAPNYHGIHINNNPTASLVYSPIATQYDIENYFAPLASPALTGTPTAPTPTSGDSSTRIATTAFVADAVSSAGGNVDLSNYYTKAEVDSALAAVLTTGNIVDDSTKTLSGYPVIASIKATNCEKVTEKAFQSCTALASVDLPVCTSIGDYAFNGCTSLASIDLPACTSIGSSAFSGCTSLASLDLPACTSIGNYAFSGCTSLASIDLPACTSIGSSAFSYCSSLTSLYLRSPTLCKATDSQSFSNSSLKIYVPEALLDEYKAASYWSSWASRFASLEEYEASAANAISLEDDGISTLELEDTQISVEELIAAAENDLKTAHGLGDEEEAERITARLKELYAERDGTSVDDGAEASKPVEA